METSKKVNCSLIIKKCSVILPDLTLMENVSIVVDDNRIVKIGDNDTQDNLYNPDEVIDANGKLAMPGMFDCHTHVAQQFLKGATVDEKPILWKRILAPHETKLNSDDIYHAARLASIQMIKSGITTFSDAGTNDMVPAIKAVQETGIRAVLTRPLKDRGMPDLPEYLDSSPSEAVKKIEDLYKQFHGSSSGKVHIWFSVSTTDTSSPELVELVVQAAQEYNTGIHLHLTQNHNEVRDSITRWDKRPPAYLDEHGLLGPNVIAAHSVHLSDFDIRLLAERGVSLIHCPVANLTYHSFPKVLAERAAGVNIALGNDGAAVSHSLDMFFQAQLLKHASQAQFGIPIFEPAVLPANEAFNMITINGAKALMMGEDLGTLETGKKADIVLIDINQSHFSPNRNMLNTLIMGGSGRDVTDVIIDGNLVLQDREFVEIDEEKVINEAATQLQDILSR